MYIVNTQPRGIHAQFKRFSCTVSAETMHKTNGLCALTERNMHANLKYKYGNRHFWCRGYYVDTVGKNKKRIEEYIRNQLQEDIACDQISLFETVDPFTGEKYKKN